MTSPKAPTPGRINLSQFKSSLYFETMVYDLIH